MSFQSSESVGPEPKVRQNLNLETIPEDVQRLILEELPRSSPSALRNLSQSSKTLQNVALPFVYRKLVLTKGPVGSQTLLAYESLMSKFCDNSAHDVARHVREITITNEVPLDDMILILDKIADCGRLRKLSWNTSAHMPVAVLKKLQSTWPDLELSVSVIDRPKAEVGAHRQMDVGLLSSPLLSSLTYVVYRKGYDPDRPTRSEWPRFTQALLSGGNVRSLQVLGQLDDRSHHGINIVKDTEPEQLSRLDLSSGARLAKLEELSIRMKGYWDCDLPYPWDPAHFRAFGDCVDLSRLRVLDFGSDNPQVFFTTFAGSLPSLKSLRFGTGKGSIKPAVDFIGSIVGLESLHLSSAQVGIDELWPAIQEHRETLRTLILRPTLAGYCTPQYIDLKLLEEVAETFTKLEHLGWDAPCGVNIDPEYLAILSTLHLRKLDLFLHIPDGVSDYSDKIIHNVAGSSEPPLDKTRSIAAARNIANTISQKGKEHLERLTLYIARTGYEDRGQPYMMRTALQLRRNGQSATEDGEEYQVRGKMEWHGHELEEELLFEEE